MARGLKTAGIDEVRALRRRVVRQEALGRIGEGDADYLKTKCDEIEERINYMHEDQPNEREF